MYDLICGKASETPLGQLSFPINPSKVAPLWHQAALMMCLGHLQPNIMRKPLITEEQRESGVTQVWNQKQNKAG